MPEYYYSTQPFIAWVINRFFYDDTHYTYVSPFYPYRLLNPKSSNPYLIYADLYLPWKDSDQYDKTIAQFRLNLRKGILAKEVRGYITPSVATQLKEVCDKIDLVLFYPIVYRVDISLLAGRYTVEGSGLVGSKEYFIPDLKSDEFDILFLDEGLTHPAIKELYETDPYDALSIDRVLKILKNNYVSTAKTV